MKIAYLTGAYLATTSIRLMLHEKWGPDQVYELRAIDLADADLDQFDLLVLPGSVGEISPYPAILREAELDNIKGALDRGLMLWTDCSASYYMMNDIRYLTSTGEEKTRTGLGLIEGSAIGPVQGQAVLTETDHRFAEVIFQRISFREDGHHRLADVCYGNGPGLYLSEDEQQNPAVQILARYNAPGAPAAAIAKRIGRGLLVSLGVLVQIAPHHMQGRFANADAERHRKALFNHLSQVDDHRQSFLGIVTSMIDRHYHALKTDMTGALRHATFP